MLFFRCCSDRARGQAFFFGPCHIFGAGFPIYVPIYMYICTYILPFLFPPSFVTMGPGTTSSHRSTTSLQCGLDGLTPLLAPFSLSCLQDCRRCVDDVIVVMLRIVDVQQKGQAIRTDPDLFFIFLRDRDYGRRPVAGYQRQLGDT